jgi:hypothetical protein
MVGGGLKANGASPQTGVRRKLVSKVVESVRAATPLRNNETRKAGTAPGKPKGPEQVIPLKEDDFKDF